MLAMETLGLILSSYLIGSIPFGALVANAKGIDLSKTGSGNTGATNVFRTLGKGYGIFVFFLDFLKGAIPVYIASYVLGDPLMIMICGAASIAGHMFSPFLKFKGGKGVATGLGVVFSIAPAFFAIAFVLGISIIAITGYVSVASITGSIVLSALMFLFSSPAPYSWGILILALIIIYKHLPNIKRLLNGTENKTSWRK